MWFSFISSFFCMIVKGCSVSVLTFLFRESQIFRSPIIFPISYVSNVYFLQCFTSSYELHRLPSSKVSSRSQLFLFLLFRQNHSKLPWVRGGKNITQREIGKSLSNSLFKAKKPFLYSEQTKKSSKKSSGLSVRSLHLLASVVILNFLKKASY